MTEEQHDIQQKQQTLEQTEQQQQHQENGYNHNQQEQNNHIEHNHTNTDHLSQTPQDIVESELASYSIPSGYVRCEECDAIVSKPQLAKHEQTYCKAALATCAFSTQSGDMCKLVSNEQNVEDDEPEFTRSEIAAHIENNVGMHLLYVMELVEKQSAQIALLQSELSTERSLRSAMEAQLKEVVTKLAKKVDHADIANFSETPSITRTTGGRTVERRPIQPMRSLHRSPVRFSEPVHVEPLPVSSSGWKPKRAANNDVPDTVEALSKQLQSTLNKLTPTNYPKLSVTVLELLKSVSDAHTLSVLTEKLFEKGLEDSFYAWMYADLCLLLVNDLPVLDDDQNKSFRVCLINLCQKEFIKGAEAAKTPDDSFDKTRQISSIRFIGELFCRSLISFKVMIACLEQMSTEIISTHSEVFVEGLSQLLMTVGPKLDSLPDDTNRIVNFFETLTYSTENDPLFSSRSKFLWLDVIERRSVGWRKRANMKEDRASSTVLQPKHHTPSLDDERNHQQRPRVTFHDDYYNQQPHNPVTPSRQPRVDTDAMQELTFEQRRMQSDAMSHVVKKWSPAVKKTALKIPT